MSNWLERLASYFRYYSEDDSSEEWTEEEYKKFQREMIVLKIVRVFLIAVTVILIFLFGMYI